MNISATFDADGLTVAVFDDGAGYVETNGPLELPAVEIPGLLRRLADRVERVTASAQMEKPDA